MFSAERDASSFHSTSCQQQGLLQKRSKRCREEHIVSTDNLLNTDKNSQITEHPTKSDWLRSTQQTDWRAYVFKGVFGQKWRPDNSVQPLHSDGSRHLQQRSIQQFHSSTGHLCIWLLSHCLSCSCSCTIHKRSVSATGIQQALSLLQDLEIWRLAGVSLMYNMAQAYSLPMKETSQTSSKELLADLSTRTWYGNH